MKLFYTLLLPLLLIVTLSCKKTYRATIPAYLVIDSSIVLTNYALQGTTNQKIKNISVAVDGTEYGLYQIPCKIPLTTIGEGKLVTIRPYIVESGQGDYKFSYLYMANYTTTLTINNEQTIRLRPVFSYTAFAKFPWLEDFENSAQSIEKTSTSKTSMAFEIDPAKVLEGNRCGKITLDATSNYYEGVTSQNFNIPINGDYTYLEMNYSTTCRFAVGLQYSENSVLKNQFALTLTPTTTSLNTKSTWNKVYVNLAGIALDHKTAVNFKFIIYAQRDTTHTTDEVLLDNLKFVTNL